VETDSVTDLSSCVCKTLNSSTLFSKQGGNEARSGLDRRVGTMNDEPWGCCCLLFLLPRSCLLHFCGSRSEQIRVRSLEMAGPVHESWGYSALTLDCSLKTGRYDAMHCQRRSCTLDSYRADLSSFPQHFFALTASFRTLGRHFVDRPFKVRLVVQSIRNSRVTFLHHVCKIRPLIEAGAARRPSRVA
jgi:hypothetical protein